MAGKFTQDLNKFALAVDDANEEVMKSVTIELFGQIVKASPVDTGRFRANWFLTFNLPSSLVTKNTDKSGQKTINRITEGIEAAPEYDTFLLTNNLPYSEVIEFGGYPNPVKKGSYNKKTKSYEKLSASGYSRQAPQGVVRVNFARFASLLEQEAQKQGYGSI